MACYCSIRNEILFVYLSSRLLLCFQLLHFDITLRATVAGQSSHLVL